MDRIGKRGELSRDEYRNKYTKTLRYTPKTTVMDAVQPIRPANNQLNNPKPTLMFNIEVLNQHADDMMDAYRNLNAREERLRDLMKSFHEDPEGFLKLIVELVKQFNQTTASVLTFDRVFNTHYSEILRDLLSRQQFNLELMGIRIVGINQLEFSPSVFKNALRNTQDFFRVVFLPCMTLFDRAFIIISGIRIPNETEPPRSYLHNAQVLRSSQINSKG